MFDLDCHILVRPNQNKAWFDEMMSTMEGQECNIHFVPGYDRDLPRGRLEGFLKGTAKYQTYVDDDDQVMPGAMRRITEEMDLLDVDSVFTLEEVHKDGKCIHIAGGHHIWAVKRATLAPYLPDYLKRNGMRYSISNWLGQVIPSVQLNWVGYIWNIDRGQTYRQQNCWGDSKHCS